MKIADVIQAAQPYGERFQRWLAFVLKWEAVVDKEGNAITENDPSDSGGRTFLGLDQRSHPTFNYANPQAKDVADIYHTDYWIPSHADELQFPLGEVVANFSVNMGLGASVKLLQRALTQFGANLKVDGVLGPKTLASAAQYDAAMVADVVEDFANDRYRSLANNNPRLRKFLQGWLNRDEALEKWWQRLLP